MGMRSVHRRARLKSILNVAGTLAVFGLADPAWADCISPARWVDAIRANNPQLQVSEPVALTAEQLAATVKLYAATPPESEEPDVDSGFVLRAFVNGHPVRDVVVGLFKGGCRVAGISGIPATLFQADPGEGI